MSKYAEDECFKKADATFIYWTKHELRHEIERTEKEISILKERQAAAKKELYSRNKQMYELNYISLAQPLHNGKPTL